MAKPITANVRLVHATKLARQSIIFQKLGEATITFGNLQVRVTKDRLTYTLVGVRVPRSDALKYIERAGYAATISA